LQITEIKFKFEEVLNNFILGLIMFLVPQVSTIFGFRPSFKRCAI